MNSTDDAVILEQARYIHRHLLICAISAMVSAAIVVAIFGNADNTILFATFLAIVLATESLNVRRWFRFRGRLETRAASLRLLRSSTPSMGLSSLIWGLAIYLIFPADRFPQSITFFCAILANTAAAAFYFGPYYPTFVAAAAPMAVVGIAAIALHGTLWHPAFFGLMAFFPAFMFFAWRFNRLLLTSLQLRFENTALVGQLTAQKERAETATLAKSRFLAAASHDLRQPLHALNLYLGALVQFQVPQAARPLLENARLCAKTMDAMFRALLDVSKLDASAVVAQTSVFRIDALLASLVTEFAPQAAAKQLTLRVRSSRAVVESDPALVERILRNLVSNAVRYTVSGTVLVGCRVRGGRLRVMVCDTGPGIAQEQQRAVFEEFYQAGKYEQGLGLGLNIVQRLAGLLDAPLALRSVPGRGSVFSISLPLAAGDALVVRGKGTDAPLPASVEAQVHADGQAVLDPGQDGDISLDISREIIAATPGADQAGGVLSGALVVVVDDEELILDATRVLLAQWGCEVVVARSGAQAVERLAGSRRVPGALISDYRLRMGETGLHVVALLADEFNQPIPALLVTGDTTPERLRALQESGLPVLHKPLQEAALKRALMRLLTRAPAGAVDEGAGDTGTPLPETARLATAIQATGHGDA